MSPYHPLNYETTLKQASSRVATWNNCIFVVLALLFVFVIIIQSIFLSILLLIISIVLWNSSRGARTILTNAKNSRPVVVTFESIREIARSREEVTNDKSLTELKRKANLAAMKYPNGAYVEVAGMVLNVGTEAIEGDEGENYTVVTLTLMVSRKVSPRGVGCLFSDFFGGIQELQHGEALVDIEKKSFVRVFGRLESNVDNNSMVMLQDCKWSKIDSDSPEYDKMIDLQVDIESGAYFDKLKDLADAVSQHVDALEHREAPPPLPNAPPPLPNTQ